LQHDKNKINGITASKSERTKYALIFQIAAFPERSTSTNRVRTGRTGKVTPKMAKKKEKTEIALNAQGQERFV